MFDDQPIYPTTSHEIMFEWTFYDQRRTWDSNCVRHFGGFPFTKHKENVG